MTVLALDSTMLEPLLGGTAEPSEIEAWVENLSPGQLACRSGWGHQWDPYDDQDDADGVTYWETGQCLRCGNLRIRHKTLRGHVLSAQYKDQPGYGIPKGGGQLTSDGRSVLSMVERRRTKEMARAKKATAAKKATTASKKTTTRMGRKAAA